MKYSANPFESVRRMYDQFGLTRVEPNNIVLGYRMELLEEELDETKKGIDEGSPEKVVDGHVDLMVVAIGSLAIMKVDIDQAFDAVMEANMRKVQGKRFDSDPVGVSIAKPIGWEGPDHSRNTGVLDGILRTN